MGKTVVAPGSLHDNFCDRVGLEQLDQRFQAGFVIGYSAFQPCWVYVDVEVNFAHIDSHIYLVLRQVLVKVSFLVFGTSVNSLSSVQISFRNPTRSSCPAVLNNQGISRPKSGNRDGVANPIQYSMSHKATGVIATYKGIDTGLRPRSPQP